MNTRTVKLMSKSVRYYKDKDKRICRQQKLNTPPKYQTNSLANLWVDKKKDESKDR